MAPKMQTVTKIITFWIIHENQIHYSVVITLQIIQACCMQNKWIR